MTLNDIQKWCSEHRDILRLVEYGIVALCLIAFFAVTSSKFWIVLSFIGLIAYCLILADINASQREKQLVEKHNEDLQWYVERLEDDLKHWKDSITECELRKENERNNKE